MKQKLKWCQSQGSINKESLKSCENSSRLQNSKHLRIHFCYECTNEVFTHTRQKMKACYQFIPHITFMLHEMTAALPQQMTKHARKHTYTYTRTHAQTHSHTHTNTKAAINFVGMDGKSLLLWCWSWWCWASCLCRLGKKKEAFISWRVFCNLAEQKRYRCWSWWCWASCLCLLGKKRRKTTTFISWRVFCNLAEQKRYRFGLDGAGHLAYACWGKKKLLLVGEYFAIWQNKKGTDLSYICNYL